MLCACGGSAAGSRLPCCLQSWLEEREGTHSTSPFLQIDGVLGVRAEVGVETPVVLIQRP